MFQAVFVESTLGVFDGALMIFSSLESVTSDLLIVTSKDQCTVPRGILGPHPGARHGNGACQRAPGDWGFAHGAQNRDMGPPSNRSTTYRGNHRGLVQCGSDSCPRWGLWQSDPRTQKHGMSPLWWGRSWSLWKRLSSTD